MVTSHSSQLTGIAGTYYVAAELSRRGYLAYPTSRNVGEVDILTANPRTGKSVSIQVKSTLRAEDKTGRLYWILNERAEGLKDRNLFYVFLSLQQPSNFYVVPSQSVANFVAKYHRKWLRRKGRHGQRHKNTNMRMWWADKRYINKWELLGLESTPSMPR